MTSNEVILKIHTMPKTKSWIPDGTKTRENLHGETSFGYPNMYEAKYMRMAWFYKYCTIIHTKHSAFLFTPNNMSSVGSLFIDMHKMEEITWQKPIHHIEPSISDLLVPQCFCNMPLGKDSDLPNYYFFTLSLKTSL